MPGWFEILNNSGSAITAIAAVALVVITALYVILTGRLSRSADQSAKSSAESLAIAQYHHSLSQVPVFDAKAEPRDIRLGPSQDLHHDARYLLVRVTNISSFVAMKPVVSITSEVGRIGFNLLNVARPPVSPGNDVEVFASGTLADPMLVHYPVEASAVEEHVLKIAISYENVFGHRFNYWSLHEWEAESTTLAGSGQKQVERWRWRHIGHDLDIDPRNG